MIKILHAMAFIIVFSSLGFSQENHVQVYRFNSEHLLKEKAEKRFWPEHVVQRIDQRYAVTNRIEGLYDLNQDQFLDHEEVLNFLDDVHRAIHKKKRFHIISEILTSYDSNQDSYLDRRESESIRKLLYD